MQRINKYTGITVAVATIFMTSSTAFAVTASPSVSPTPKVKITCSNVKTAGIAALNNSVNGLVSGLDTARKSGDAKILKLQNDADASKKKNRNAVDTKFNAYIDELYKLVKGNEDNTKAVDNYATAMRNAINVYRHGYTSAVEYDKDGKVTTAPNTDLKQFPSVDGADAKYRSEQAKAIGLRRGTTEISKGVKGVDGAIEQLRTAYGAAAIQAATDCSSTNKTTKAEAIKTFNSNKNKAKETYKASFKDAQDAYKVMNNELKANREATVAAAKTNFAAAKNTALNDLLKAFGITPTVTVAPAEKLTATFVNLNNTNPIPTSQSPLELGLNMSAPSQVSKVEWYLGSMDKKDLKFTDKGRGESLYYPYKWDISKLSTGKYKWMARVYDNDGKPIVAKSKDNKAFLEVSIAKLQP